MNGKGVLAFVGKSIAFSLISGLIWGMILVFIAGFSTRHRHNASASDERTAGQQTETYTQQVETYEKQAKQAQEQLDRSLQQQKRSEALLDTQERLYAEQERLQKRFAAIIDKWEKASSK
jgi:biopolymer transport protein ExbB/TolQ